MALQGAPQIHKNLNHTAVVPLLLRNGIHSSASSPASSLVAQAGNLTLPLILFIEQATPGNCQMRLRMRRETQMIRESTAFPATMRLVHRCRFKVSEIQ